MKRMEDIVSASWILSPGKLKNGGERSSWEKNEEFKVEHRLWRDLGHHSEHIQYLDNFREARSMCEIW